MNKQPHLMCARLTIVYLPSVKLLAICEVFPLCFGPTSHTGYKQTNDANAYLIT